MDLKLFLFDLDGTLVTTGGAGLRALERAFRELYGLLGAVCEIDPSGKTDPSIFREIIRQHFDREMNEAEFISIKETYLSYLRQEMTFTNTVILPGVVPFLHSLKRRSDVVCGLGTGNFKDGAQIKLSSTEIASYFRFGGYGCDSEDRSQLLQKGHERAEHLTGHSIPHERVFVIGDTARDIAAADKAGYRSVAVASGTVPYETLHARSPHFLLRDMTEGPRLLQQLDSAFFFNHG